MVLLLPNCEIHATFCCKLSNILKTLLCGKVLIPVPISHRELVHLKSAMLQKKFENLVEVKYMEYEIVVNRDEQSFSFRTSNNVNIVWTVIRKWVAI